MEMADFSSLANRVSGKGADAWEVHRIAQERRDKGADILILSIGEDVAARTPEHVVDACIASLNKGRHHYSHMIGQPNVRQAIVDHHAKLTGQELSVDNCVVFAGAQNGLFAVSACLLEAGDEVIVIEPYYSTYPATFTASGAKMVTVVSKAENGFQPNLDDIKAAITPRTKMLVVNTPANPSGAVFEADLVKQIVDLVRAHDLWLLSDEVYSDFVFEGRHVSPSSYMDVEEKCVVVSSLSKSHRMSGWRVGWAIGPELLCQTFERLALCMMYGMPMFTQDAATAALTGPQTETEEMVAEYGARARLVVEGLANLPRFKVGAPKAGMFVMLDVREMETDGMEFAMRLLDQSGISTLPCGSFGEHFGGFVRMSLCAPEEKLSWACGEISKLVKSWD
ncbi:MAG: pyridoxal phosphate-dependent aminotransferase [Pseudomonadota bacterium]